MGVVVEQQRQQPFGLRSVLCYGWQRLRHPHLVHGEGARLVGTDIGHRAQRLYRRQLPDEGIFAHHAARAPRQRYGDEGRQGLRDGRYGQTGRQ